MIERIYHLTHGVKSNKCMIIDLDAVVWIDDFIDINQAVSIGISGKEIELNLTPRDFEDFSDAWIGRKNKPQK